MSNIITFLITKKTTVTNVLHVRALASKKMYKLDIYIWNNLIPTYNTIAVYLQHNTKTMEPTVCFIICTPYSTTCKLFNQPTIICVISVLLVI